MYTEAGVSEHYHLWIGHLERPRRRNPRAWAADGGGDFPEAVRATSTRPAPRGRGVRSLTTARGLRFESRAAAHKHRAKHYPRAAMYRVIKCDVAAEHCPSPEPIPIWERRDDR